MPTANSVSYSKEKIRYAVLSLFLAQGLCFASWASRLTDIKSSFDLSDLLHFGLLVTLQPIGKFLAIPIVGFLMQRIGSKNTVLVSLGGFIVSLFFIGLTSNIYILGTFFTLFGICWNMTDISLNTQAIEVERMYGRTIIATFHAGWSIAACAGALIGFLVINLNVSPGVHFMLVTVLCLAVVVYSFRFLLDDVASDRKDEQTQKEEKARFDWKVIFSETILFQLGLVWLFALIIENTMFDWSNVYFESTIHAPKTMQVGFLVFMVMMTAGRLLANYAYRIWSKPTVLKIAGTLIFIGFFTSSILIGHAESMALKVVVNSIGFMLIGLGISCIVPTIYSIVGEKVKSIPVGAALTIMSGISFVGPLVTNVFVGFVSKHWGLEIAYLSVGFIGICILLIVSLSKTMKRG
ncbi:MAG: MFS transporter [Bacteroidales bacterium 45-6]|nr:MAG: MFS transporter [Bacteroidales bacterium 45-6]